MTTAQVDITTYMTNDAGVKLSGEIELVAHVFINDYGDFEIDWLETANGDPIRQPGNDAQNEDEDLLWRKVEDQLRNDADTQSRAHYAIQQEAA